MKDLKRIILALFVLVGGASAFGYWSLRQFEIAFDDLSASYYVASPLAASLSDETDGGSLSTTTSTTTLEVVLAATSTATTTVVASSEVISTVTSTPLATSTPITASASLTDVEVSFLFPKVADEVYIGCTYQISWESSATIHSLEVALVDGGTRKATGPVASGLAKENNMEPGSENMTWKVGMVWPGEYFILISKINGVVVETQSGYFMIQKMPGGMSVVEQETACKESGGLLQ